MRNLAAIMVRPRATMRRILDGGKDRAVPVLVLLAICAGLSRDVDVAGIHKSLETLPGPTVALMAIGIILIMILLLFGYFYVFAWMAHLIGPFLGGKAELVAVRSALAWGMAPLVWSLLYRIPVAIWLAQSTVAQMSMRGGGMRIRPGLLAHGCGVALVVGSLDLIFTIWALVAGSHTLGEAFGFSSSRGFAVLIIALAVPAVVALAAGLAILM